MQQVSDRPAIAAAVIVHGDRFLLVQRRVSEGSLSWQFPAGEIEPSEAAEEAAVRETREETGLTVSARVVLGERVHPNTGRTMIYVACEVTAGEAYVADEDELADVAWCALDEIGAYVPYGFYGPVQEYLEAQIAA
jgi:8-oxo-dGTP diphosphatase